MPRAVEETIARGIAGLGVLGEGVERLALVGPLHRAVVTRYHRPITGCGRAGGSHQGRPIGGAGAVAHRLAAHVLVEAVESHALGIDQDWTHGGLARHGGCRGLGGDGGKGEGREGGADE